MALARTRRADSGMNYWPGFVDALSTLVLGIIFLLTVFVVVQFYLQQEVAGKDTALDRLKSQIASLTNLLSLEKNNKADAEDQLAQLRATLAAAESERDKYKGLSDAAGANDAAAQGKIGALAGELEGEKKISEATARITELGQRLNIALAERVKQLSRYQSEFFGKLREILGNRPDVRIVGDRFVLQSEVFFDTGKADLKDEGRAELDKVADALLGLEKQIPPEISWVLRVDGHTDVRPITGGVFKSNWDLSAARTISVVQYLIAKGVAPKRLVAAGFGEFQPIEAGATEDAYRRNRRIELKLTER